MSVDIIIENWGMARLGKESCSFLQEESTEKRNINNKIMRTFDFIVCRLYFNSFLGKCMQFVFMRNYKI